MESVLKHLRHGATLALAFLLVACTGDISPGERDLGSEPLPGPGGAQLEFTKEDDHYRGTVDASGSDWIYVDLKTQTQVSPSNPATSDDWDLAFKGADIKLNGGVSGAPPSGIEAAVYPMKEAAGTPYPFEEVDAAPTGTAVAYVSDERGFLGLGPVRYAMTNNPEADVAPNRLTGAGDHGWYHSSGSTAGNVITPRINVGYVLRAVGCRYYKLRMTGYADAGGAVAHPSFDLKEIRGPACGNGTGGVAPMGRASFSNSGGITTIAVDASSEDDWVYLDLTGATQTVPATPATDAAGWEIALQRSDIKLNGGASGIGNIAIHDLLRDDWAARTAVPADAEWHADSSAEELAFVTYPPREIGGECAFDADGDYGWYYYSGFCDKGNGNHHISPRDVVYIVRGRNGTFHKLRILAYYSDTGTAGNLRIEIAPVAAR